MRPLLILLVCWWIHVPRGTVAAQELQLEPWVLAIGTEPPPKDLLEADTKVLLRTGQAAPFEGVLLSRETAARWAIRLDWYKQQRVKDGDDLRAIMKELVYAQRKRCDELEASYKREIEAVTKDGAGGVATPFWRRARFGYPMGVITAGIIAGLAVWVAK